MLSVVHAWRDCARAARNVAGKLKVNVVDSFDRDVGGECEDPYFGDAADEKADDYGADVERTFMDVDVALFNWIFEMRTQRDRQLELEVEMIPAYHVNIY